MMNLVPQILSCLVLSAGIASAQLAVTVSPVKVTGQKAVVPLAMQNGFSEKIESARAVCFLMDEQGKTVGPPTTRWVIGGSHTNGLAVRATNSFHFVVTSDKPFTTTNLTAKVSFSRVVLEGGKLADVAKDVQVAPKAE
jgi:hypothetical protein